MLREGKYLMDILKDRKKPPEDVLSVLTFSVPKHACIS